MGTQGHLEHLVGALGATFGVQSVYIHTQGQGGAMKRTQRAGCSGSGCGLESPDPWGVRVRTFAGKEGPLNQTRVSEGWSALCLGFPSLPSGGLGGGAELMNTRHEGERESTAYTRPRPRYTGVRVNARLGGPEKGSSLSPHPETLCPS